MHNPSFLRRRPTSVSISLFTVVLLLLGAQPVQCAASDGAVTNWGATGIIVPLYSFAFDNSTWAPLRSAAAAHPRLPFYVVLNPYGGPGPETGPSEEYAFQVSLLKELSNIELLGYVDTALGTRNPAEVRRDVRIYSQWASSHAVDGIYFDRVADDAMPLYYGLTNFVMLLWNEDATIVLNTAKMPVEAYFEIADQIVTYEDAYGTYSASSTPSSWAYQQSVILHSLPMENPEDALRSAVAGLRQKGVGSVYVTDLHADDGDVYAGFGTLLDVLADAVDT